MSCTDVTQAADVIGRAAIVQPTQAFRTLVASLDVMIVRPTQRDIMQAFLYLLMSTRDFVAHTTSHTTGTTVLHLEKAAVPSYLFACPPAQVIKAFNEAVKPMLARLRCNHQGIETLTALRESLLPRLVSGFLPVDGIVSNWYTSQSEVDCD